MDSRLFKTVRVLLRGMLIPTLLLCVSLPSWTASTLKEGYSIEQARRYYIDLDEGERKLIHQRYERFSSLTAEERDDLRSRSRNLARISKESENLPLPQEVQTELGKLTPKERRQFKRSLLKEELREKGRELLSEMPETSQRELKAIKGASKRAAFMRRYKQKNEMRVIDEMIRIASKRFEIADEERDRILTLPKGERLRAFLELNDGLTEEELVQSGLPFGITPEQWGEWRSLPGEEFFTAVIGHREKKRHERREWKREHEPAGLFARPNSRRLAGLAQLVDALRKRPRDFVELADLKRGRERRLELGKRKRALCVEALRSGALASADSIDETQYMNDAKFFRLVRAIIDDAGGAHRIAAWIASGSDE